MPDQNSWKSLWLFGFPLFRVPLNFRRCPSKFDVPGRSTPYARDAGRILIPARLKLLTLQPREIMANNHSELEKRLWDAADDLRANSKLKSAEYSIPVLGLIFLRYADHKFAVAEKKLAQQGSGRRKVGKTDYQAQGVLF